MSDTLTVYPIAEMDVSRDDDLRELAALVTEELMSVVTAVV